MHAQELEPKDNHPRFFVRSSFSVPGIINNQAFKAYFRGIYEANINTGIYLFNKFNFGVGYKNSMFALPPFKVPGLNIKQMSQMGYLRLGFDHYQSKTFFISYGISYGQCNVQFAGIKSKFPEKKNFKYSTQYIEPSMDLHFLIADDFSISFNLSYNQQFKPFDPYAIGLNEWVSGLGYLNQSKPINYFNIGLGFYVGLIKHKN